VFEGLLTGRKLEPDTPDVAFANH